MLHDYYLWKFVFFLVEKYYMEMNIFHILILIGFSEGVLPSLNKCDPMCVNFGSIKEEYCFFLITLQIDSWTILCHKVVIRNLNWILLGFTVKPKYQQSSSYLCMLQCCNEYQFHGQPN